MTKYEQMEREFFSLLKSCGAEGYPIKPHLEARKFNIETRHLREKLVEWANAGLICLYVHTEEGFRPYTDWPNANNFNDFFEYGNKVGNVWAKLLAAGDEHLERLQEIKQRPIGFQAKPV
jgi:hypothetical protein